MTPLSGWENFYVILGSSAGALIGLQFVVMTLIAGIPTVRGQSLAGEAFATPTIVHFGTVVLLSALLNAPWRNVTPAAILWGLLGGIGVIYEIIVVRRMRTQTLYSPVFEDWLFHVILPVVSYGTLAASSFPTRAHAYEALFGVAAASLLLLFVGIHNAWDAVTYHIYARELKHHDAKQESADPSTRM